eukprot:jgi/Botrbrau1/15885/Bobra.40_1s0068.1
MLRVGVDVGGTNTDAVVMQGTDILGWAKRLSTENHFLGVLEAVKACLTAASVDASDVQLCALGTTVFINALIQKRGLVPVVVLRLCGPASRALPPFCDLPADLFQAVMGAYHLLPGGFEYDGGQLLSPLDDEQLRAVIRQSLDGGRRSFVVSGIFSPVNRSQEEAVGKLVLAEAKIWARENGAEDPEVYATLSHELGGLGLIERENAAILNAALRPLAAAALPQMEAAFQALQLNARLYLTSNDGTLMPFETAKRLPIATVQSGPVNSVRGAAVLTGLSDGLVIDIGGTTTDVGALVFGLPRSVGGVAHIAGVRTNYQLPDLLSVGLGGGSLVEDKGDGRGVCVGPQSVASRLLSLCLACGGDTCTATDVAVRLGHLSLSCPGAPAAFQGLSEEVAKEAWDVIQAKLEDCVDQMKTSAGDVPVVIVGGGAPLCGTTLSGVSQVLTPKHASIANAVGAALPKVSGMVDAIFKMGSEGQFREEVLEQAERTARERAIAAGAAPHSCRVAVREEVPLAYLPGGVTRVHVQVVGDLVGNWAGSNPTVDPTARSRKEPPKPDHTSATTSTAEPLAAPSSTFATPVGGPASTFEAFVESRQGNSEAPIVPASMVPELPVRARGSTSSVALDLLQGPGSEARVDGMKEHGKERWEASLDRGGGTGMVQAAEDAGTIPGDSGSSDTLAFAPTARDGSDALMRESSTGASSAAGPQDPPMRPEGPLRDSSIGNPLWKPSESTSCDQWAPEVTADGDWLVSPQDVEALAIGCGILGTGGGGSPHNARIKVLLEMLRGKKARVVSPFKIPEDALVGEGSGMGAPTVSSERLDSHEAAAALRAVVALDPQGRELWGVFPGEVGGGNGLEALVVAMQMDLPVVDIDMMGRAFPELQMITPAIYGYPVTPSALADVRGNVVIVTSAASATWLEELLRPTCTAMGCSAGFASAPLSGRDVRKVAILHSLSNAWHLGVAVLRARDAGSNPIQAVACASGGKVVFEGKVVDVKRETSGGFARGGFALQGLGGARGRLVWVDFQNENLVAREQPPQGPHVIIGCVPDLLCLLETDGGRPVQTEEVRYGLRASLLLLPAPPLLRTAEALAVVGPAAFGYPDVAYSPCGEFVAPQPVPRVPA